MNILIVNDDSIYAPGIALLAKAAKELGKVWVVAPAQQCSAMSHKITLTSALTVEEISDFSVEVERAYKVDGTPADCVKVALRHLLPEKPDFVFSGINDGYNIGCEIAYSGTVAAAMEAIMNGVPAIAFSSANISSMTIAEKYIVDVARAVMAKEHNLKEVWNVNFPADMNDVPKGILFNRKVAPVWLYDGKYQETVGLDGKRTLMIHGTPMSNPDEAPKGSDMEAVLRGYISIGTVHCAVR